MQQLNKYLGMRDAWLSGTKTNLVSTSWFIQHSKHNSLHAASSASYYLDMQDGIISAPHLARMSVSVLSIFYSVTSRC